MDAGGHRTELGVRAGCKCLHFWFLLTILFLQWTQSEKNVFCENWEELTSCVCKAPMSGTVEKIVHNKITKITFGMTGAHPVANKIHQEVLPLFYVAVFSNQKMLPGFTVHLMLCKADSGPLDCDEGIWIYVLFPCTCTLSPKNNPNRNETLDYGAIWMILFRNSPIGVPLSCAWWMQMRTLALCEGQEVNGVLCNRRPLAHFFQSRKTSMEAFFCQYWRNIFWLLQTPSLKLVPLFMDRHQDDMPPELTTFVFLPVVCKLSRGVMSSTKQLTDSKLFVIVREEIMCLFKWKLPCDWSMWEAPKKWNNSGIKRLSLGTLSQAEGDTSYSMQWKQSLRRNLVRLVLHRLTAQIDCGSTLPLLFEKQFPRLTPLKPDKQSHGHEIHKMLWRQCCAAALCWSPIGRWCWEKVASTWMGSIRLVYIKRFMIFCMYGGCRQTIDGQENGWIFVQNEMLRRSMTTFYKIFKGLGNKGICTKSGGCRAPSLANALGPNAAGMMRRRRSIRVNKNGWHFCKMKGRLEVVMPMKSTGTTSLAMLRTTLQYTLITGRQEGVLSKICSDCVRGHNMLLFGRCALLGESQRRFGDSSCSLSGKLTACVVVWVSVPPRHHLLSSTEFCYTCLLPSACSIACLMNGNVVTQLVWTNTMVRRARLDCVLSTTWKYWVNGIAPPCGGGVVHILRGTMPQDISVENLELRLCCSNVHFRAGCEDIVFLIVFHCWMCLMLSPVLHARVYGWLCPTLLGRMMQPCCNNAMTKLTCVFLPEMQTCVFNLGRVLCKEIQLHVHCSWKYITHHWTSGCEKLSNLNSWLWILFPVVWWTFQSPAMRMTWQGAVFLNPVRSYICTCPIQMKYWTKNYWRLAYNKIQRSRSTLFFLLVRVLKVSLLMCTKTGCFQEERALMPNTWVVGDILKVATILKYVLVDGQPRNSGRAALVVFSAMVRNAALSGLECLVLTDSEYRQLDATICKFSRKVLRGDACRKTQSATGKVFHAISDTDVYKLMRLVPSHLELCIRRLQYWQSVAREPHLHKLVLAAVFGKMVFDTHDTVLADGSLHGQANLWAKQLESDVLQLLTLDSAAERLVGLNGRILLLFSEFRNDFVCIDCGELRSKFFSVCIPPPGFTDECPVGSERDEHDCHEHLLQYSCTCHNEDGTACTATFATYQALAMHIRRTSGGTHGKIHDHVRAAVCNQCPWCRNIFASIRVTQNHISRRLQYGRCGGSGSAFTAKVATPRHLQCPFCDSELNSLDQLYNCIVSHF